MADSSHTSCGSSTTYSYSETCGESKADGRTLLEIFSTAPEFVAFSTHLRKAAQVLTVADFMRLRKYYDAEWSRTIAEL